MKKIVFVFVLTLIFVQNGFSSFLLQEGVSLETRTNAKNAFLRVLETREILLADPLNREKFEKYMNLWDLSSEHALALDTETLLKRDDILTPFRHEFDFKNLRVSIPEKGKVDLETDVVFTEKAMMFAGKTKIAHVYATFIEISGTYKLTAITELESRSYDKSVKQDE